MTRHNRIRVCLSLLPDEIEEICQTRGRNFADHLTDEEIARFVPTGRGMWQGPLLPMEGDEGFIGPVRDPGMWQGPLLPMEGDDEFIGPRRFIGPMRREVEYGTPGLQNYPPIGPMMRDGNFSNTYGRYPNYQRDVEIGDAVYGPMTKRESEIDDYLKDMYGSNIIQGGDPDISKTLKDVPEIKNNDLETKTETKITGGKYLNFMKK